MSTNLNADEMSFWFPNKMALRNSEKNKEFYLKIKDKMVEKELDLF